MLRCSYAENAVLKPLFLHKNYTIPTLAIGREDTRFYRPETRF